MLDDLLATLERRATVTPVTPCNPVEVSAKPFQHKACTLVTPVTPRIANNRSDALKVGALDPATASGWWLIHFADRDPVEVACTPEATHAEVLERHPDAIAAEPFTPTIRQPLAPLTAEEVAAIRAWLAHIEETDPATIADALNQCQRDAEARDYFTGRAAAELSNRGPLSDDRRSCEECANLTGRRCLAVRRGEFVASRDYEPERDLPRRCEGYNPGANDDGRRPIRERWPGLVQKGGE